MGEDIFENSLEEVLGDSENLKSRKLETLTESGDWSEEKKQELQLAL